MKKFALFVGILALAFLSQTVFAQNSFCQASFIEESFSLDSGKEQNIFLTVKNNSDKDFFVDLLSFESNELFSFEQVNSIKVFAENYGLIEVKIIPGVFESEKNQKTTAFLSGHFEDGTRCFLEKEFIFLIRAKDSAEKPLPEVSFSQEIDKTGAGFITVTISNPSAKQIEIRPRTANANTILGKTAIYLDEFSSTAQTITVNNASDGEIVYFSVYSDGAFLEEKFIVLKVPVLEEENNFSFETEPKEGFVVSSYSSKVDFLENTAIVWAEITSVSENPQNVFIELKNLPQGISASASSLVISPNETKQVILEVQGETTLQAFNAILSMQGEISTSRQIVFENKSLVEEAQGAGQEGQTQEPDASNFLNTAFAVLSDNILVAVLAGVIILLVFLLLLPRNKTIYRQSWIAKAN